MPYTTTDAYIISYKLTMLMFVYFVAYLKLINSNAILSYHQREPMEYYSTENSKLRLFPLKNIFKISAAGEIN